MKCIILFLASLLLFFSTKTLAATRPRRKFNSATQEEASSAKLAPVDDALAEESTSCRIDFSNTYTRPATTSSYTTQNSTKSAGANQQTPEEKRKAKEALIIAEVGGGLAYTANVYVLDALLLVTNPEIVTGVISVLAVVKIVGFAYCAYGWFTT